MYYGLNKFIKNILPKQLFYRGLLIVAAPIFLLQITVYCGVPCGVEAFRNARKVLEEDGVDIEKEFSKND